MDPFIFRDEVAQRFVVKRNILCSEWLAKICAWMVIGL
jgi:hypothetical protein